MELFKILFEDENVLAVDKPAGVVVFSEGETGEEKTLIHYLLKEFPEMKNVGEPPRYGIVHRLDKDTSGILLVAKNNGALEFLQKQFQEGGVVKKYLALAVGDIKEEKGTIDTLLGREPKDRIKQKAFLPWGPDVFKRGKRPAITEYRVLNKYSDGRNQYTLLEVEPKTGRKHQIRVHLAYLGHPLAGDKMYGFKNQPTPKSLTRQFLHASYLKIKLPSGKEIELRSHLPEDLQTALNKLKIYDN